MKQNIVVFLSALVLVACAGTAPPVQPPEAELPDGSLFLDEPPAPGVAARAAEWATLEDPGVELPSLLLTSLSDLELAELSPGDERSAPFFEVLLEILVEGLDDANYLLAFDPEAEPFPDFRNGDGVPLVSISRIDRELSTCTTRAETAAEEGEDLTGYGGRQKTATEGICGGIAVAHSFLELNLLDARNKLRNGDNFNARNLAKLQGSNRKQMTLKRLRQLHQAGGATVCRAPAGAGFETKNLGALRNFNRQLSRFVNDPNRDWDCSLFVRTRSRDGDVLAHVEHVTAVTTRAGTTSIRTLNGFDQGNQRDRVPLAPGTNTWTSTPGGSPPFKLTSCTGRNGAATVRSTPNVGLVNYVCCRRP